MREQKYIRVFVSSTFADMNRERNILQERVFPDISAYCQHQGWQFEAIDLRWGINSEASYDQRTMEICLKELHRCQDLSPKPNFILLLGERYGWRPLPETLSIEEYQSLTKLASGTEKALLETWYVLDHNALPQGEYRLHKRCVLSDGIDYRDDRVYQNQVYTPLFNLMVRLAKKADSENFRIKFASSATEQEIVEGALKSPELTQHVIGYLRTLTNVPKEYEATFKEKKGFFSNKYSAYQQLADLKHKIRGHISHIISEEISYSEYMSAKWAESFANEFKEILLSIVNQEIASFQSRPRIDLITTTNQSIINTLASTWAADQELIDLVKRVFDALNRLYVTLVIGGPGSDLSSLAAQICARTGEGAKALALFIGKNEHLASGKDALMAIANYLGLADNASQEEIRKAIISLSGNPLFILIIDGVENLDPTDPFFNYNWLPPVAEGFAKMRLVFTSTSQDFVMPGGHGNEMQILYRPSMPLSHYIIMDWLVMHNRKLTQEQEQGLISWIESYSKTSPLKMRIIAEKLMSLQSSEPLPTLPHQLKPIERFFIEDLSQPSRHGSLAKVVAAALAVVRDGISLDEIRRCMPLMRAYSKQFDELNRFHRLEAPLVPTAVVVRLLDEMMPLLSVSFRRGGYLYHLRSRSLRNLDDVAEDIFITLHQFFYSEYLNGSVHAVSELYEISINSGNRKLIVDTFTDFKLFTRRYMYALDDELANDFHRALSVGSLSSDDISAIQEWSTFDLNVKNFLTSRPVDAETKEAAIVWIASTLHKGHPIRLAMIQAYPLGNKFMLGAKGWLNDALSAKSYRNLMINLLPFSAKLAKVVGNKVVYVKEGGAFVYDIKSHNLQRLKFSNIIALAPLGEAEICLMGSREIFFCNLDAMQLTNSRTDVDFTNFKSHLQAARLDDDTVRFAYLSEDGIVSIELSNSRGIVFSKILKGDYIAVAGYLNNGQTLVCSALVKKDEKNGTLFTYLYSADLSEARYFKEEIDNGIVLGSFNEDVVSAGGNTLAYRSWYQGITVVNFDGEGYSMQIRTSNSWGRAPVCYVDVSKDGRSVITTSGDSRLMRFDVQKEKLEYIGSTPAESPRFSPSANHNLILANFEDGDGGYNKYIDLSKASIQTDFHHPSPYDCASNADGSRFIVSYGGFEQMATVAPRIFEMTDKGWTYYDADASFPYDLGPHMYPARAVAMKADGSMYAFARGYNVKVVNLLDGQKRYFNLKIDPQAQKYWNEIDNLDFTPDGKYLITIRTCRYQDEQPGWLQYALFPLSGVSKAIVREFSAPSLKNLKGAIKKVALSNSGRRALLATQNGYAYVDLADGQVIECPKSDQIIVARLLPDGQAFHLELMNHKHFIHLGDTSYFLSVSPKGQIKEFSEEEKEDYAYCLDSEHFFAVSEGWCKLYDSKSALLQIDSLLYAGSESRGFFLNIMTPFKYRKPVAKGLLMFDGYRMHLYQPTEGCKINQRVVVTAARAYDFEKNDYGGYLVTCPSCGRSWAVPQSVINTLHQIARESPSLKMPSQELPRQEWARPALLGQKCPHCGVTTDFNPFESL